MKQHIFKWGGGRRVFNSEEGTSGGDKQALPSTARRNKGAAHTQNKASIDTATLSSLPAAFGTKGRAHSLPTTPRFCLTFQIPIPKPSTPALRRQVQQQGTRTLGPLMEAWVWPSVPGADLCELSCSVLCCILWMTCKEVTGINSWMSNTLLYS